VIGRRRRSGTDDVSGSGSSDDTTTQAGALGGAPGGTPSSADPQQAGTSGPFDAGDVDPAVARKGRVDLGGILVPAVQGMKLQFRVDEKSGKSGRVTVVADDAAVELIAIAAPRSSGMWEQTRAGIMEDAKRRGGKADEAEGPFGTELRVLLPVTTSDGKKGVQPSRIAGIDGRRWMLRATFIGGATTNATAFARLVQVVRGVVVVRGERPMAPGDVIALTPPVHAGDSSGAEPDSAGSQPGVG